ncbi:MAG: hypothetical protein N3E46_10195 [Gemmataceae bacterium]|nr:hypothetical protein [Gemmataceae bacterium]
MKIQWKAAGLGNGFPASYNAWNTSLDSNVGRFGSLTLISPKSPHGLRMQVLVQDNGNYVALFPGSHNHMATNAMLLSPISIMSIIACRYQFCVYRAGGIPQFSSALAGVPFLRARNVGHVISGVAENNGRFEVSTSAPHNYATNQYVTITGAEGAPAMNGTWQIEVTGSQSFILLNSSYSPGYVNNSARAAGPAQISDAVWASANNSTTDLDRHLRSRSYVMYNPAYWFSVVNNMVVAYPPSTGDYSACLASIEGFAYDILPWFDGTVDILTPRLGWQLTQGGNLRWVGDMWAAFIALNPAPLDAEIQFDGRTWINVSTDNKSSLWWAVS